MIGFGPSLNGGPSHNGGPTKRQDAATPAGPHVLIVVQNLPVPLDRRVRLECLALIEAGYRVTVVCPKGTGDPKYHEVDGIRIYKYKQYPPTQRKVGFIAEYLYSFVLTLWLSLKVWRREPFDVLQVCNPPDIFWPLGMLFHALGDCAFVFDQHDLCPELYDSRFPGGPRSLYRATRLMERLTYHVADHVIATNESYRSKAFERGAKKQDQVTVVRTGPDPNRLRKQEPIPDLRRGRQHLVSYLGVMGPQDGVDIVLRAADKIVHDFGREDISFLLMGTGDCFEELVALCVELDLEKYVEFTGRIPDAALFSALSTSDIGLSPDPKNPLNDLSTMNKTMEYMSFGLPVVAFDLRETRVSAGEAGVYVTPNDIGRYARAIVDLLDDESRRFRMGPLARARVETTLAWHHQRPNYVRLYDRLVGRVARQDDTAEDPVSTVQRVEVG